MAARETSPLLPSRVQQPDDQSSEARRRRHRVRRALYVAIPVAAVTLVLICWSIAAKKHAARAHATTAEPAPETEAPQAPVPAPSEDLPQYTDSELLTLLPPFVSKLHPIPPRQIQWPHAVPTNAFWTNLLIGDGHGLNYGAGEVTLSPYSVRSLPQRLEVSYGDSRRVATNASITEYFNVDTALTGYSKQVNQSKDSALLGDGNSTTRSVVDFDPLSVTVAYHFEDKTKQMKAPLVRGSPYVTVEYESLIPVVEFNATVMSINGESVAEKDPKALADDLQQWTSRRFEIDTVVYGAGANADDQGQAKQKWILYFAEPRTLHLQFANEKDYRPYNFRGELTFPTNVRLVDTDYYTGAARLAVVPHGSSQEEAIRQLDDAAHVYPVGSTVEYGVDGTQADVSFCWKAKQFDGGDAATSELLMLANPHHVAALDSSKAGKTTFEVLSKLGHRTLKSTMTAVRGECWHLQEELPDTGFTSPSDSLAPEFVDTIAASLKLDTNYTPEAQDPYYFGKEIGRQARLALIADQIGEDDVRDEILGKLQEWVTPWMLGQNSDYFVYDRSWGGLCSVNGLKGVFWMTDFGNGWYNDHHFHYGYFLYAIAVLAKFRPEFADAHRAAVVAITRDIASPSTNDPYFPFTRHFSWFDGHSFASGVYTLDGGKSQESVSEAINAYYGVYLVGKAFNVPAIENIGHLLLAQEIRAAKTYWQMTEDSDIYESVYAANKMTGQVAATKVSYTTWFGPQPEHMHLINMIPFTPITEQFLSPEYVEEEYPVLLEQAFDRAEDPIEDRWKGYAYLDLAIIDPAQAWTKVRNLTFFDDGSSLTNSLYWIATRPATANATILNN